MYNPDNPTNTSQTDTDHTALYTLLLSASIAYLSFFVFNFFADGLLPIAAHTLPYGATLTTLHPVAIAAIMAAVELSIILAAILAVTGLAYLAYRAVKKIVNLISDYWNQEPEIENLLSNKSEKLSGWEQLSFPIKILLTGLVMALGVGIIVGVIAYFGALSIPVAAQAAVPGAVKGAVTAFTAELSPAAFAAASGAIAFGVVAVTVGIIDLFVFIGMKAGGSSEFTFQNTTPPSSHGLDTTTKPSPSGNNKKQEKSTENENEHKKEEDKKEGDDTTPKHD